MGTFRSQQVNWMTPSVAALVVGMLGCSVSVAQTQVSRPPPFAVVDSARPNDEMLRAYIHSLTFLSDHISADQRMLDPAHANLVLRAEPVADNYLITEGQLRVAGRITARLVNRGMDPIDRFALAPKGTTYLWIQYAGESPRGVLISTDSTGAIRRRVPVRVNPLRLGHPRFVKQALARLGTDSTGTMVLVLCAPCPPWGWCRADSVGTATWYPSDR
ncbi:MAG: hypothetical protein DMD38_16420 [Gemmatimonadetes bacterium]|nr:MAG: hypothetical protein DMD38_16420 [Gemmatimonadota bacterium]